MPRNQEIITKSDFLFSHAPNLISHLLTLGSHIPHFLFPACFSKGLCNFIYFMTKEALLVDKMGGDRVRYEPENLDDFKNDPLIWNLCVEGGIVDFLDYLKGHDE